jgi:hypothetical protein
MSSDADDSGMVESGFASRRKRSSLSGLAA